MADTKQLKLKIASTKNIRKITNALEIISTLKLQKIKKKAEYLRDYVQVLLEIVDAMLVKGVTLYTPNQHGTGKHLLVVVSSEKGLCGSLNTQLFKHIEGQYADKKDIVDVFAVGKKAYEYCTKQGYNVVGTCSVSDAIQDTELKPLFEYINEHEDKEYYEHIGVAYNFFKNTMKQIPLVFSLKPFTIDTIEYFTSIVGMTKKLKRSRVFDIVLEPDTEHVRQSMRNMILDYCIYSAVLHNKTGEFAARMIAMKGAKDNASTIIDKVTLQYNKARQDAITQEISEIVGAKSVIEN